MAERIHLVFRSQIFNFVAVIGFDLILKCTLKPETRQRVFFFLNLHRFPVGRAVY